ncbi:unnamed protein product [Citrullus colocynthis]|uniref:Uncharacterized protein n=1 Tax=Citrullus colocynthis TaxID=252529 RepID=A0ABP0XXV2_9ROSI
MMAYELLFALEEIESQPSTSDKDQRREGPGIGVTCTTAAPFGDSAPNGACLTSGLPLRNISLVQSITGRERKKTEERESQKSLFHFTLLGGKKFFPSIFCSFQFTTRAAF